MDVGVLTLKSEQKKVTANMVTLNFWTFLIMTVQDGLAPVLKIKLDVINSMAKMQEAKGLILMTSSLKRSCWSIQTLSRISNENPISPSSRESHAIPSLLQEMLTL